MKNSTEKVRETRLLMRAPEGTLSGSRGHVYYGITTIVRKSGKYPRMCTVSLPVAPPHSSSSNTTLSVPIYYSDAGASSSGKKKKKMDDAKEEKKSPAVQAQVNRHHTRQKLT